MGSNYKFHNVQDVIFCWCTSGDFCTFMVFVIKALTILSPGFFDLKYAKTNYWWNGGGVDHYSL